MWGTIWPILAALVIPFLTFSYMIGSLVHVHHVAPDIKWWKRREWTKFKGQMEGTTVLRAPKGLDFFPALAAIVAWTNQWLAENQPHPIVIVHNSCGHVFEPCFGCNVCGKRLARREIHFDNQRR